MKKGHLHVLVVSNRTRHPAGGTRGTVVPLVARIARASGWVEVEACVQAGMRRDNDKNKKEQLLLHYFFLTASL